MRTRFCARCVRETTNQPAPSTSSMPLLGYVLVPIGKPCPRCRSYVEYLFFCVFFLPLVPLGRYRVILTPPPFGYTMNPDNTWYVGRKIRRGVRAHRRTS